MMVYKLLLKLSTAIHIKSNFLLFFLGIMLISNQLYSDNKSISNCGYCIGFNSIINTDIKPTFDPVGPYCQGDNIPDLPTISLEDITGSWSPEINNTETTVYTFTPDLGQCASSVTLTIEVLPYITPTFNQVGPFCQGTEIIDLPSLSLEGISGIWNPPIDNISSNIGQTTHVFIPDDSQLCILETTMTITILDPNTIPTFDVETSFCQGDNINDLPSISLEGIVGTWSPEIDNTTTTSYTFTPSNSFCLAESMLTIQIDSIIAPTFNPIGPYCLNQIIPDLPTTSIEGFPGTWFPPLSNTETNTYTFTPDGGVCALETITLTVEILPVDDPTFDPYPSFCVGESIPNLPFESLEGISGFWNPAINNQETTTYTFTPDNDLCSDQVDFTIEITPGNIPTFGPIGPFTEGAQINDLPTTSIEGIFGTWSPEINNTTTTTYTYTPNPNQCAVPTTLTIVIEPIGPTIPKSYTFDFKDQFGNEVTDVDIYITDPVNSLSYPVLFTDTLIINSIENEYPGIANHIFRFEKSGLASEGVSALDLITLRKHILIIEPISDIDILAAGDANGNGSISAVDMIALQKIILGIDDEFPNNLSTWFVKENDIPINNFPTNHTDISVVLIKRGNVRE